MASSIYIDAVLLLGDSLTQAWSAGSIAQRMAEYYLRRLDVVNRGYGGYNTDGGIAAFEQALAKKVDVEAGRAQPLRLVTIWFGANDAVLPGCPQYVPLDRFVSNLEHMVDMVRSPTSEWYQPNTRVLLISPPPIIEADRAKGQLARWREFGSKGAPPNLDRDKENTKKYAQAVVDLGAKLGVPTVDLWHAIVEAAGGEEPDQLRDYFYDGLHLTARGYEVLFDHLTALIVRTWPELDPEKIPMRIPHWSEVDTNNPRKAIGPRKDLATDAKRDEL